MEEFDDFEIGRQLRELEAKVGAVGRKVDKCEIDGEIITLMNSIGGLRYKYTHLVYLPDGTDYKEQLLRVTDELDSIIAKIEKCNCSIG